MPSASRRAGDPRSLQLQQRLQAEHLGLVGREVGEHAGQPHRLGREVGAHPVVARGGGVALVEDQVDHGHHVVEPRGPLRARRQLELRAGRRQRLLRPRDALAHGRLAGEEAAGDLGGGEAADQPQRQRGARLGRQRGVAGEEDQPQDVVLDVVDLVVEVGHRRLLPAAGVLELGDLATQRLGAPEVVDAAALGGRHQPGDRIVRDARHRPLLQRGDERVLRQVLGEARRRASSG